MAYELKGIITQIMETKQVSERFTKREFVVETNDNPKYPQVIMCQITGDKVTMLDGFAVGDQIRAEFNLRGREWRSPSGDVKYFTTIEVWKLEPIGERRAKTQGTPPVEQSTFSSTPNDDIPFIGRVDVMSIARVLR